MDKSIIMKSFIFFCRDFGLIGRFHPGEMTFFILSPSLGWTEITYDQLHFSFPDRFPALEPVQTALF